ncbi:MAG: DUF5683 domain-containing protein [Cryomorphaceae bacterium]|nr:DUF5683 domain-containing protein [Flavobacteriales bacterium]
MTSSTFKTLVALLFLLFAAHLAKAQRDTTTVIETTRGEISGNVTEVDESPDFEEHSPKKASILSAVLPGAGQVYNKKYWKVPIIYGGFAVAGYFLNDNLKQIRIFKEGFQAENDGNPNTENTTGFSSPQLVDFIDQYKTWRDWSYVAFGIIYILNIVDASVDAHLFHFDVSEDISMNVAPYHSRFGNDPWSAHTGLSLTLKL